jgi:hypothetical protein
MSIPQMSDNVWVGRPLNHPARFAGTPPSQGGEDLLPAAHETGWRRGGVVYVTYFCKPE